MRIHSKALMQRLVATEILDAKAYLTSDRQNLIKLDAMELSWSWSQELKDIWLKGIMDIPLNRYPDSDCHDLKQALSERYNIPKSVGMILGNGSDELIQMILMLLAQDKKTILTMEPSFVMYRLLSQLLAKEFVGVSLNNDFSLDLNLMLEQIEHHQPAVIFIAWPNNPTGGLMPQDELIQIVEKAPGLVIIDEAYYPFSGQTMLPYIQDYPHMLVMRTLSKSGLAGLRLGFLLGHDDWIEQLEKLRLPYNIGSLNQFSAAFISQYHQIIDQHVSETLTQKKWLFSKLSAIDGIQVYPSEANFILFRTPHNQADPIHQRLLDSKILIKNLNGTHPRLKDCLRISIGDCDENRFFFDTLLDIIGSF